MKTKPLLLVIALLTLSSCTNLSKLQEMNLAASDEFNQALAQQYLAFAKSEAAQHDWYDSEYFAKKGIKAASGRAVWPEKLEDWGIKDDQRQEVSWARSRLITILDRPTKLAHPYKAAKTQFLFDCWLEQQEEGWQSEDINQCRAEFLLELAALEKTLGSVTYDNTPIFVQEQEITPVETQEPTLVHQDSVVHFAFGSTQMDSQGAVVLDTIVKMLNDMNQYIVYLRGHADRAGQEDFNLMLSKNRAQTIAQKLQQRGVTVIPENIKAFGESAPVIKTEDGVANKQNRRVEINIQGRK